MREYEKVILRVGNEERQSGGITWEKNIKKEQGRMQKLAVTGKGRGLQMASVTSLSALATSFTAAGEKRGL